MGRFSIRQIDEIDGENEEWEFVADPGEEGAMVVAPSRTSCVDSQDEMAQDEQRMSDHPSIGGFTDDRLDRHSLLPISPSSKLKSWRYSCSFWFSSLIVLIVALGLHKELPPAPPLLPATRTDATTAAASAAWSIDPSTVPGPPSPVTALSSWEDYVSSHVKQLVDSFSALVLQIPLHVGSWWLRSIHTDVQLWYEVRKHDFLMWTSKVTTSSKMTQAKCAIRFDQTGDQLARAIRSTVIGQELAVRIVAHAWDTWRLDGRLVVDEAVETASYASNGPANDEMGSSRKGRPLLLFFTGFYSVGKTRLAKRLAHEVLVDGDDEENRCTQHARLQTILEVSARDFALTTTSDRFTSKDDTNDDDYSLLHAHRLELTRRILRHVRRYPKGSMVLIQDCDTMPPSLFVWLIRTLSGRGDSLSAAGDRHPPDSRSSSSAHESGDSIIRRDCSNTIFIFSSSAIGRNVIGQTMRRTGGRLTTSSSLLEVELAQQVEAHFAGDNANGRGFLETAQALDAVVPFGPLLRTHLLDILRLRIRELSDLYAAPLPWNNDGSGDNALATQATRRRASRWKELVVTDSVIEALLSNDTLEYMEWNRQDHSVVVDNTLVHPLVLTVAMKGAQLLNEKSGPLWNNLISQVRRCFVDTPNRDIKPVVTTAVVDFSDSTEQDNIVVLSWCVDLKKGGIDDRPIKWDKCDEVCQFTLS